MGCDCDYPNDVGGGHHHSANGCRMNGGDGDSGDGIEKGFGCMTGCVNDERTGSVCLVNVNENASVVYMVRGSESDFCVLYREI